MAGQFWSEGSNLASQPEGRVIPFRQQERAKRAAPSVGPCEILLFTGVRYERHETARDATATSGPAPKISGRGGPRRQA